MIIESFSKDDGVVGCYQQYYQSSARQVSCNEGYEMRESPVLLGGVAFVAPEDVTEGNLSNFHDMVAKIYNE